MKDKNDHINEHTSFFQKVEIPYEKTKDEVWEVLSDKLKETLQKQKETKIVFPNRAKVVAAALALILLSTTFFLRFYTTKITCPKGKHMSHILPDGSIVELNAESTVSYNLHWWYFKREVTFEGEAFFSVERGERFTIVSNNGTTEILGTSFNIFARNASYKVFCKTGKIKVSSFKSDIELVVNPGELAIINNKLKLGEIQNVDAEKILGWQINKFNFTSEPLLNVIDELERQYDVEIGVSVNHPNEFIYTGYFAKSTSIESPLNFICKSFNLNFKKNKKGNYIISSN